MVHWDWGKTKFSVFSFQGDLETSKDSESVCPVGHVGFVEFALGKQSVGDVEGTISDQFQQDQVLC